MVSELGTEGSIAPLVFGIEVMNVLSSFADEFDMSI